ncbi:type II secretion system F family protein [Amnibacterium endophyticum]|uniref:Type II secretion system F family protein n=1 Tax=Amnibacterium endophyticum TaxID=2109337 RepID=A0ABW4LCY5_9MICO
MRRPRLRGRRRRPDLDLVAGEADRLAALVGAGAVPAAAFRHLARAAEGEHRALVLRAAAAAGRGEPLAPVFAEAHPLWRRIGATAGLATSVGAPLAPVLRSAAAGARAAVALERAVAESVAGPAASARLVLLLPPAALLLGGAFGFDVAGVLLGDPLGLLLLAAGGALLGAAALWSRRLIRAASAMSWTVGLRLELVATGVRAGLPVTRATGLADRAAAAAGLDSTAGDEVEDVVAFAAEAGVPVVALLEAEADRVRLAAVAEARLRATVLAARLLLPLGLLVLPAFLVLGAVPIGLAVLRASHLAF